MNKQRSGKQKQKKNKRKKSFHTRDSWSSNQLQIYTKYVKLFLKNVIILNTIKPNVYKQCHSLKRKPKKITSIQLYERFELQYEQKRADKEKKQKENFRAQEKQYNHLNINQ